MAATSLPGSSAAGTITAISPYTANLIFGPAPSGIANQDHKITATDNRDRDEEDDDEPVFLKKPLARSPQFHTVSGSWPSATGKNPLHYPFRFCYAPAYRYILFRSIRI